MVRLIDFVVILVVCLTAVVTDFGNDTGDCVDAWDPVVPCWRDVENPGWVDPLIEVLGMEVCSVDIPTEAGLVGVCSVDIP